MDKTPIAKNSVLDIDNRASHLAKRMAAVPTSVRSSCSFIYRVPSRLRRHGKEMYEPNIISIGPFHHGKETLGDGEKYKPLYLHSFLRRNPNTILRDYVKAMTEIEVQVRECYAEEIHLNSDDFVQMLILDGCFILELLLKYREEESNMESKDCLFSTTWKVPSLRRDLTLLENQVPFLVLDRLYNLSQCSRQTLLPLIKLALDFFDPILPTILIHENHPRDAKHLLDLLRNHLVHQFKPMEFGSYPFWEYTNCATSLEEAGVKFQRKGTGKCLLDISFTRDGKFQMPPLSFGESWNVLFPNLIALEQCRRDYPDMVTSYVILVNKLINSAKDVELLSDKGIIECLFMKGNKVAQLVDRLCRELVVDKFYYDGLCNRVNAYRRIPRNRCRASLLHNHINTSWAVFTYGAALILLVLTLAQTFLIILKTR